MTLLKIKDDEILADIILNRPRGLSIPGPMQSQPQQPTQRTDPLIHDSGDNLDWMGNMEFDDLLQQLEGYELNLKGVSTQITKNFAFCPLKSKAIEINVPSVSSTRSMPTLWSADFAKYQKTEQMVVGKWIVAIEDSNQKPYGGKDNNEDMMDQEFVMKPVTFAMMALD
ncbi:hypothetical protein Tco_0723763 [Tanacetum coccineum]